jgi:hypothetical protein
MKRTRGIILVGSFLAITACRREMPEAEYRVLANKLCARLTQKQNALMARVKAYEHYDWNQDTGQLVFTSPGRPTLVADIQFVGDVSKRSGTWLWAWANPSVTENIKRGSRVVKQFGETRGIWRLTKDKWKADQADGWQMTAIAVDVLRADASYRTEDEGGYTFMTVSNLRIAPQGMPVDHSGDSKPSG